MVNQFLLLILFGTTLPIAFLVAFIWDVCELQSDKRNLILSYKRPIPITVNTIGIWVEVLELAVYIAILSNSANVSLSVARLGDWFEVNLGISSLMLFLLLLMLNFMLRFFLSAFIGDIPYRLEMLLKRHEYIFKSTVEYFKKISETTKMKKLL